MTTPATAIRSRKRHRAEGDIMRELRGISPSGRPSQADRRQALQGTCESRDTIRHPRYPERECGEKQIGGSG